ncbi:MAG: S24/S26 family peptidase [Rikenellaceae bacterium]
MAKIIIQNNIFFDYIVQLVGASQRVELPIKGVSMYPTLREYQDRVVLINVDSYELFVGAILLFKYNGSYLLHRLVKIDGDNLILRGDSVHASDQRVTRTDVVAIVESIIRDDDQLISCTDTTYKRKVRRYMLYLKFYRLYISVKRRIVKFKK